MRTILFRNQRPNVIGPYIMRTGDRIYLWNGKVGVNAQTLPFPFALKFLNNSRVCTQAKRNVSTKIINQARSKGVKNCSVSSFLSVHMMPLPKCVS